MPYAILINGFLITAGNYDSSLPEDSPLNNDTNALYGQSKQIVCSNIKRLIYWKNTQQHPINLKKVTSNEDWRYESSFKAGLR
jgi:hypothetical protein